ncbi:hypothetical protein B0H12DRAFT_30597 [Mycena haematopus]|nr:hypothetical protein B0H12DRAFT_30597 [Mycena haematopus]
MLRRSSISFPCSISSRYLISSASIYLSLHLHLSLFNDMPPLSHSLLTSIHLIHLAIDPSIYLDYLDTQSTPTPIYSPRLTSTPPYLLPHTSLAHDVLRLGTNAISLFMVWTHSLIH